MNTLPRISGRDCVKALLKVGFIIRRQQVVYNRGGQTFLSACSSDHKELIVVL